MRVRREGVREEHRAVGELAVPREEDLQDAAVRAGFRDQNTPLHAR